MTSLEDRLDAGFAAAWKPAKIDTKLDKAAEKLVGVVAEISRRTSDFGPDYVILVVRRDDGSEAAFHAFHTTSRAEVQQKQPQVGERVAIGYFGTGPSGKPGMAGPQLYRLVVDRDETSKFDYDKVGDEPEAAAEAEQVTEDDGIPW